MHSNLDTLQAGAGRAIISPAEPGKLQPTGMTRLLPTRGVLDDLTVEALAVSAGGEAAFILSGDLRRLEPEWVRVVRARVAAETGVDPGRILFSCTHNHCSNPEAAGGVEGAQAAAERAVAGIVAGLGDACLRAWNNLQPAEMAPFSAQLEETIGEVRRMRLGNGTVVQCWGSGPVVAPGMKLLGAEGPPLRDIDGLFFRSADRGLPLALLTSYSAHPHLYELPFFSGETPGAAKRELERRFPGLTHIYGNGTPGDIDMHAPHPMPAEEEAAITWFRESCALIGRRFAEAVAAALARVAESDYTRRVTIRHRHWAQFDEPEERGGRMMILNALVLNDTALVSIPGEMFSAYGQWMRAENPFRRLLLLGYNGSTQGYVATPLAYEQGGYETMRGPATSRGQDGGPVKHGLPLARKESGGEISRTVIQLLQALAAGDPA